MTLGDLLAKCRSLIGAPSAVRFTNQTLIGYANDACNAVAYEVDFPEATYQIELINGITEYQLDDLVKILRVYVAQYPNNDTTMPPIFQQPILPADLGLIEGIDLERWDQTGPHTSVQFTPPSIAQQQTPSQYPIMSPFGPDPYPTGLPYRGLFFCGRRPEYYLRGGNIGIIPTPNVGPYWVVVDHVPVPFIMNQSSDLSAFQDRFKDAIVFKMCEYCMLKDRNSDSENYQRKYEEECNKLRAWRATVQANQPNKVLPITKRTYFRRRRTGWN